MDNQCIRTSAPGLAREQRARVGFELWGGERRLLELLKAQRCELAGRGEQFEEPWRRRSQRKDRASKQRFEGSRDGRAAPAEELPH